MSKTQLKERTHDVILNKLGRAIVRGTIRPLDNLPNDIELCAKYKIGRSTLREVLKVLSAKGLIKAAPKRGTWVNEPEEWDVLDADILNWSIGTDLNLKILKDVSEVRILIEPSAARLAAKNAKISDLAIIEDAYERMENAIPNTTKACEADVDFHMAVFRASHNKLWMKFGNILSFSLVQLFKSNALQDKYLESLPMHKKVLQAIRMRDEHTAEVTMREMTQSSIGIFKKVMADSMV